MSLDATKIAVAAFLLVGYRAQSLLNCRRLNSIYIGLAHGAVCEHMPETLSWMFCTMAIIMFSGMTLFTFRAALLPDKEVKRGELEEIDDVYENQYSPSIDKDDYPYVPNSNTEEDGRYQYSVGPSVSTFTNSQMVDSDSSVSTGIVSTGIGSVTTSSVERNSSTNAGLYSNNNESNMALDSNDNNARPQTAPASMDVSNNDTGVSDVNEAEDEVEVTRLPTNDADDIEIQVSQRSLVVDVSQRSLTVDETK